jgi:hypothetical protein
MNALTSFSFSLFTDLGLQKVTNYKYKQNVTENDWRHFGKVST